MTSRNGHPHGKLHRLPTPRPGTLFVRRTCAHCSDPAPPFICPVCRDGIFASCGSCHAETVHGAFPWVTDGRPGGVPVNAHRPGEDPSPLQENAIRELENGA